VPNSWFDNIRFYFLHETTPCNLDLKNRRSPRLRSVSFQLINDILFQKKFDGVFLRCLEKEESERVLAELHSGDVDSNFGRDTTAPKVLRDDYYCPTLFRDSHNLSHKFIICQKDVGQVMKVSFPLHPVTVDTLFQQWGLYIIGPSNPPSSQQHTYILTETYYFMRCSEALQLKIANMSKVMSFLNSHIITRFEISKCLVFDNAFYFSSLDMNVFALEKGIKLKYSTNYYPKGNGLAESTNKNLIKDNKENSVKKPQNLAQ